MTLRTIVGGARRRSLPLLVLTLTGILLASCGLQSGGALPLQVGPGSITKVPELDGVQLTVGSKDFTENVILGYIAEFALSAAGADVRDLTNIQGSNSARAAMEAGQIDLYYEYTGTGWINYLHHEHPIRDPEQQFTAVRDEDLKKNGIVWVDPAPMDNTYALATNQRNAKALGVRTLSDYANLVHTDPRAATTCLETEFNSRQDGFPGMAAAYGFDPHTVPVKILQTGIIYQATADGTCTFGEVFTTDGRVKGLNLVVLEDDKQFFPHYNAAVVMREEIAKKYPQIAEILRPVSAALTNPVISDLNAQVDVHGKEPADVARDWMVSKGFVTAR
ncbi:glycine betaine ABC transporter substrate-binding protein [Speluncibacter jeojiensis]|uniref:Glycine betaine ABC transporter substrate-binding protein n=1 Tax=Speluncibacter jeojiensis TaxID=2710754 RepID=A0A9X4LW29_9ACTN|nr:glycine betaine ABC transporter substrate-binding protein [Corynebacteriales bacterium D3-21]